MTRFSCRRLRTSSFLLLAISIPLLAITLDASAAIDLTGRWRVAPSSADTYADIVQTGDQVSVVWTEDVPGAGPITFDLGGTFDQTNLSVSAPGAWSLSMRAYGPGDVLDGTFSSMFVFSPNFSHRHFTRCECYDGNTVDGDGCDSECRIEPCFSCTPEPSVCTPSPESAACNDRNDCTTGETCSAGVCAGGLPVAPCVNLDGLWRVQSDIPDFDLHSVSQERFVQRDGVVTVFGSTQDLGDMPFSVGSVNVATGEMSMVSPGGSGFCVNSSSYDATAAPDNRAFVGTGSANASTPHFCMGFTLNVQGFRCDAAAGCDLSDCTGMPDGTACIDDDPCTDRETCTAGACHGRSFCPLCTVCDGSGGCLSQPRTDCRSSLRPGMSRMQTTNSSIDENDDLRWSWTHGAATSMADFGRPDTLNDVALCVFGDEGGTPSLLFQTTRPATATCDKPPCWKITNDSLMFKSKGQQATGITSMSLRSGEDGKAAISVRGKGGLLGTETGFLGTPVPVPLRTQLQIDNGSCFELDFEQGGVKENLDGVFKASGAASMP